MNSGSSDHLWLGCLHILTPGHGMRVCSILLAVMPNLYKEIRSNLTCLKGFTVILLAKKVKLQTDENRTDGRSNNSIMSHFNHLKPNDAYRRRTAPLTSKVAFYIFIQQI